MDDIAIEDNRGCNEREGGGGVPLKSSFRTVRRNFEIFWNSTEFRIKNFSKICNGIIDVPKICRKMPGTLPKLLGNI